MEQLKHEFRLNADPTLVSQATGLTILPGQIMENGEWRVSVPGVELTKETRGKLQPFLAVA
ncbi:MAG: hypothetical protein PHE68_02880 [Candidatus Peribacteraceae bacterium]|nr:hypothetical protein [Candidatus Peribacteraceae bacterium]MDD5075213.1 hypothetical protein [Candidatus Peribacteraceae bacterium]